MFVVGYIYEALDRHLNKDVALKVEKKDKSKTILMFEYNVLINLKGLEHTATVYDFVQNSEQNLIVMDLLGKSIYSTFTTGHPKMTRSQF